MFRQVLHELKSHAPFTAMGAATGIVVMALIIVTGLDQRVSEATFDLLHPAHVVLSALVTTAMYRRHSNAPAWLVLIVGYTGSIGIATLSDAIMPFWGGWVLGVHMHLHIPVVEATRMPFVGIPTWVLVNGAAAIGITAGFWRPRTQVPHLGHVLLSTWASLFSFAAFGEGNWLPLLPGVFVFLFLAVWLPCCASDIIYPLLWVRASHEHKAG
jgi:hypothetical protein